MKRCGTSSVQWLEFDLFRRIPGLVHGVFLRQGGVSAPPFSSLNLSEDVGDDPAAVMRNWDLVADSLGLDGIVKARQCHGKRVVCASGKLVWEGCDGLITMQKGLGVAIRHADCQVAFMYDPVTEAIAMVHAGWRGQVLNIYERALDVLRVQCGALPENVLVGISPSIGPLHARLDYTQGKMLLPPSFFSFEKTPLHFNLWELARAQLMACGVHRDNIEIAELCTFSHPEDFFSFRRDQGVTGRNVSVMGRLHAS